MEIGASRLVVSHLTECVLDRRDGAALEGRGHRRSSRPFDTSATRPRPRRSYVAGVRSLSRRKSTFTCSLMLRSAVVSWPSAHPSSPSVVLCWQGSGVNGSVITGGASVPALEATEVPAPMRMAPPMQITAAQREMGSAVERATRLVPVPLGEGPELQEDLANDVRARDRAPRATVTGVRVVVAHHEVLDPWVHDDVADRGCRSCS